MNYAYYATKIIKNFNYQNFLCHIDAILDKICLNYARSKDFMPFSQ